MCMHFRGLIFLPAKTKEIDGRIILILAMPGVNAVSRKVSADARCISQRSREVGKPSTDILVGLVIQFCDTQQLDDRSRPCICCAWV